VEEQAAFAIWWKGQGRGPNYGSSLTAPFFGEVAAPGAKLALAGEAKASCRFRGDLRRLRLSPPVTAHWPCGGAARQSQYRCSCGQAAWRRRVTNPNRRRGQALCRLMGRSPDHRPQSGDWFLCRVQLIPGVRKFDHVRDRLCRRLDIALCQQIGLFVLTAQKRVDEGYLLRKVRCPTIRKPAARHASMKRSALFQP
jgi:hypothetical protein